MYKYVVLTTDHIYANNHKIDKKGMIKVLILNFFNQKTLQWMLPNIVYNNTWLLGYLLGRLFVPGGRALSISLKVETLGAEIQS